ncbi:hypothetical protein OE88DRAFT_668480 [Heliocybe sulcata]|uniref:RING-type domain-containing protein n=1 Tax=Heliocybe sulcata TaxID=5364 RepID=A0A5C3NG20_9AGAM|nr:hypothetical protein OE88DRAFT_668480 [Heliocybe sulcata]
MDIELKCNRLTCRRALVDKAVVTTCSHIFCVECANELFNASRLCPACETPLTEPDDVVICSRAIAFWQYQTHQENSFQQAVLRNLNDKNAQLQKQLDNVLREANSEISLLGNKISELERDLELERRKVRDLQDASRERDKEYQKLKTQYDRVKRKALLGSSAAAQDMPAGMNTLGTVGGSGIDRRGSDELLGRQRFGGPLRTNMGTNVDIGAVAAGMEAAARTPIVNRTVSGGHQNGWQRPSYEGQPTQRRPFAPADRPLAPRTSNRVRTGMGWAPQDAKGRPSNRGPVIAPPSARKRPPGAFKPGGMTSIYKALSTAMSG